MKKNFTKFLTIISSLSIAFIMVIALSLHIDNCKYSEEYKNGVSNVDFWASPSTDADNLTQNSDLNLTVTPNSSSPQNSGFNSVVPNNTESLSNSRFYSIKGQNIFRLNDTNIITHLEINPSMRDLSSLSIKQTIGHITYTVNKDELGTDCYLDATEGSSLNNTFYFTRPAIYTVTYTYVGNDTVYIDECYFSPEKIDSNITELKTDGNSNIKQIGQNFYCFDDGEIVLKYNSELYTAIFNDDEISGVDKKIIIPDNTFDTFTLEIKSKNGFVTNHIDIKVCTADLEFIYSISESTTYDSNKVFNDDLIFSVNVSDTTKDKDGNYPISANKKSELLELFDFKLLQNSRNADNTEFDSSAILNPTEVTKVSGFTTSIKFDIKNIGHAIFTLNASAKANGLQYTEFSNLETFKIITRVPVLSSGNFGFGLYMQQNEMLPDYLSECLSGKLTLNTKIYNSLVSSIRLYPRTTGISYSTNNLSYTNTNIAQAVDITPTSENVYIRYINTETPSFDDFYVFNFKYLPKNTANTDLFTNYLDLSKLETLYTFKVLDNYSTNSAPVYMKLTYNGSVYTDFDAFNDLDVFNFTAPGDYTLELSVFPTFSYVDQFIKDFADNASTLEKIYAKKSFSINGAYIIATTYSGKTLLNHQYTNETVKVNVFKTDTQSVKVYYNNIEDTETNLAELIKYTGAWKIVVLNADGTVANSFEFTILQKNYQGFSIVKRPEYSTLLVEKLTLETPETYEKVNGDYAYHITEEGKYKISISQTNSLAYTKNEQLGSQNSQQEYSFNVNVVKSKFYVSFVNGTIGSRITEDVIIKSLAGASLQAAEILLDGEQIKVFTAEELANFETLSESSKTFSNNGIYTVKLYDVYGNTYEAQIEKFYKTNTALIVLIVLGCSGLVAGIVIISKSRRKIKVK